MSDLPPIQAWVNHACTAVGVDPQAVDLRALLDMTRDVAHHVDRPAAPVTAFIIGLAAGSRGSEADVAELSAQVAELARSWEQP